MNRSTFNKTTINGALSGAILRTSISAYPAAYITLAPRVFRRSVLNVQPQVVVTGVGRKRARSQLSVIGKAGFRWANSVPGYTCRALIKLTAHNRARGDLSLANQAVIVVNGKQRIRGVVVDQNSAQITLITHVKSPTNVRSPSSTQGYAVITVNPHRRGTLPVQVGTTVQINLNPKIRRRSAVAVQGIASITATAQEFRQIPYDLPAPPDRTFQVTVPNRYVYVR